MKLSLFGEKYTARTGILALMEDMSAALESGGDMCMLGGGNPASIPEVNRAWRERMEEIMRNGDEFERMVANYDTQKGRSSFLEAAAEFLNRECGWSIDARNVAVTNGSQPAFFMLLNLFGGASRGGRRRIVLPLVPEYIGYADQGLEAGHFKGFRPSIEEQGPAGFKYRVDFDSLELPADAGAICASRPTNPTGNVLTDGEVRRLADLAGGRDIPFLLDNAYGAPFPRIMFEEVKPFWDERIVFSMSLSKIGLPGVRTGIIIARPQIIEALAACNAIVSLADCSFGQVLTEPLLRSGRIASLAREFVRPFYEKRSRQAIQWIAEDFPKSVDYAVHKSQGAIFLWIWFKNLSIGTRELYERLKRRGVVVVPGEYFFFGLDEPWEHSSQCIRLNYSQAEDQVRRGIRIIGEEAAGALKR